MAKITPPYQTNDKSSEFLEGVKLEDYAKQWERQLAISKSASIQEIQHSLEQFFPKQSPEILQAKTVDGLMYETKNKLQKSFVGVSSLMQKNESDPLTRKIWELGGHDIAKQIEKVDLSGHLYSKELGDAYTEHLKLAEKKALDEWKLKNEKNQELLKKDKLVAPFMGRLSFLKKPWQRDAVREGTPVLGGAAAGGISGAILGGKISALFGSIFGGVGALAGGIGGLFAPELMKKLKLNQESRQFRANERKNRLRVSYAPFQNDFETELRNRLNDYKKVAEEIRKGGNGAADEIKNSIETRVNSADDKEKGELISLLLTLKKNPTNSAINEATRAFSFTRCYSKQFQISFLEAVRQIPWIDKTISLSNQLNHKAALDETFTKSSRQQEHEFIQQFHQTSSLSNIFSSFDNLEKMEVSGKKPFAELPLETKDSSIATADVIYQNILTDLSREGKQRELLRKFSTGMSDSVGIAPSTRLMIALQFLFVDNKRYLVDGTLSLKTKQQILSWIRKKDLDSRINIPDENESVSAFGDRIEKELLVKGKSLLEEMQKLNFGELEKITVKDYESLSHQFRTLSDEIIRLDARYSVIKDKITTAQDKTTFEGILNKLKDFKDTLHLLVKEGLQKKREFDSWKEKLEKTEKENEEKIGKLKDELSAGNKKGKEKEVERATKERKAIETDYESYKILLNIANSRGVHNLSTKQQK